MSHCPRCHTSLAGADGVCPVCAARAVSTFFRQTTDRLQDMPSAVPGYELGAIIGRGGMGVVHRAIRSADGLAVAVKLMPPQLADREDLADRFVREVEALAALQHPHILKVMDHGISDDGRLFLVTELAASDVSQRLKQGSLPMEEALRLFRDTANAIGYAHEKGVLHRDVKPANLLLMADGSPRVADFSLAKIFDAEGGAVAALTQTTEVFGTPYYIAPEVRLGAGSVDARADIYSLGVLLHELLTGRLPIGGHVPASQIVRGLPPSVDALIARCLKEDIKQRPQNVAALTLELDRALHPRRRLLHALVAGTMLPLIATGVWLWTAPPPTTTGAAPRSSSPTKAKREQPWINSLGMKFLPVPGTKVLFSVWETRRRDIAAISSLPGDSVIGSDDHPVASISWLAANEFCESLTRKEHADGTLPDSMRYRLPEDDEWSKAAGLPPESGATPEARSNGLGPRGHAPFSWGREWPPQQQQVWENNAGSEREGAVPMVRARLLLRHSDAWPTTAPVGSFRANALGLFDLGGNVAEWTLTPFNKTTNERTIRGACWDDSTADALRLDARGALDPRQTRPTVGFRIVLEK